jgi:hypothetical protein
LASTGVVKAALTPSRATQLRLEQGGWTAVGTWFPFRYFTRVLDAAAPADEAA